MKDSQIKRLWDEQKTRHEKKYIMTGTQKTIKGRMKKKEYKRLGKLPA